MKPLIQSSSEAPFTSSRLPTSHHLSACCYPSQATPLHHRWRMCISLYGCSIQEIREVCKKRAVFFIMTYSFPLPLQSSCRRSYLSWQGAIVGLAGRLATEIGN